VLRGRPDPGVAIVEVADQLHHADQDLGIGESGNVAIQTVDPAVELLLGDNAERCVRQPLDLAGQQRQVGAPALVPGQGVGVDDAEQFAQPLVVVPRLPVLIVAGAVQLAEACRQGRG
jgi:hypothetical protein